MVVPQLLTAAIFFTLLPSLAFIYKKATLTVHQCGSFSLRVNTEAKTSFMLNKYVGRWFFFQSMFLVLGLKCNKRAILDAGRHWMRRG